MTAPRRNAEIDATEMLQTFIAAHGEAYGDAGHLYLALVEIAATAVKAAASLYEIACPDKSPSDCPGCRTLNLVAKRAHEEPGDPEGTKH